MGYVDLYCERLAPGLFAEPLNALTNAAFFLAAWLVWRHARRHGAKRLAALPVAFIVAIGIGSTLFHTFATTWARVADELPILLFQLVFLWLYGRRAIRLGVAASALLVAGFLAASLYARQFPDVLNGSLTYAPAVAATLALGLVHWLARKPEPFALMAAGGVLAVSVFLRTIDEAVCASFPLGTHFLWHLLNAVVLYLGVRSLTAASSARA